MINMSNLCTVNRDIFHIPVHLFVPLPLDPFAPPCLPLAALQGGRPTWRVMACRQFGQRVEVWGGERRVSDEICD